MIFLSSSARSWKYALCVLLACQTYLGVGQSSKDEWQVGTILEVKQDEAAAHQNPPITRYDITLKVGNTTYVVLYTPPPGSYGVEFSAGSQRLFHVGNQTIEFNDILGKTREVPILSRKANDSRH